MTQFPRVWLDGNKMWASDGFSPEDVLGHRGYPVVTDPAQADVIVVGAQSLPLGAAHIDALSAGAGLIVVIGPDAENGQPLLPGLAVGERLPAAPLGLEPVTADEQSAGLHPQDAGIPQDLTEDLLARVAPDQLRPTATLTLTLTLTEPATVLLRVPGTSRDPGPVVAAAGSTADGRWVALGVRLDPASGDLFFNAVTHAARRPAPERSRHANPLAQHPAWLSLKSAVAELRPLQSTDGSITEGQVRADVLVDQICRAVVDIAPEFPHDADYLAATVKDLTRWSESGYAVPDFLDSLLAFHPERDRIDGRTHLVLFPMYTQNGNPDRNVEAVLIEVIWPGFIDDLEAGDYSNKLFVPIRFLDFTPGYDTNSAVLFPETVAMREVPKFSWGAIFADREAARFRSVVTAAADITRLALPPDAARLLADQQLAEQTFVMWDLIHDRTHMHGDLPFDPFMIKQRMPYFLYTLEELRCDLTAFRESVKLEQAGVPQARLVQYAILFDRIFRFAITGSRVRNYDGLGGQLLFAWLHQHRVLHWTDNRLTVDWSEVTEPVLELGRQIEHLYWQSIDRSKTAHWLAAYQLVSGTVAPSPRSTWAKGPEALPLDGPVKGLTDAVLPDEFPLSMFYEALNRKLSPVVSATAGITG